MNWMDATEMAYKNGQADIIERVENYLLNLIHEWSDLPDSQRYGLANMQVYNHVRACLDDLDNLKKELSIGRPKCLN